jgi:hypothetical protein
MCLIRLTLNKNIAVLLYSSKLQNIVMFMKIFFTNIAWKCSSERLNVVWIHSAWPGLPWSSTQHSQPSPCTAQLSLILPRRAEHSPEVYITNQFVQCVDVWALGICVIEKPPFIWQWWNICWCRLKVKWYNSKQKNFNANSTS